MTLICVSDEGNVHVFNNVLAYDCLTKEDVQNILNDKGLDIEVTDKQYAAIKWRLGKFEGFPDLNDLRWVIEEEVTKESKVWS